MFLALYGRNAMEEYKISWELIGYDSCEEEVNETRVAIHSFFDIPLEPSKFINSKNPIGFVPNGTKCINSVEQHNFWGFGRFFNAGCADALLGLIYYEHHVDCILRLYNSAGRVLPHHRDLFEIKDSVEALNIDFDEFIDKAIKLNLVEKPFQWTDIQSTHGINFYF